MFVRACFLCSSTKTIDVMQIQVYIFSWKPEEYMPVVPHPWVLQSSSAQQCTQVTMSVLRSALVAGSSETADDGRAARLSHLFNTHSTFFLSFYPMPVKSVKRKCICYDEMLSRTKFKLKL